MKFILSLALCIIFILHINSKYPFFYNLNGPWVIGYNKTTSINEKLIISQNNIISVGNLKYELDAEFLADPFFLYKQDSIFLFVEKAMKDENTVIDLFIIADSIISHKGTIFDPSFNTSYPQVFEFDDTYYMLPHTMLSNNVLLYSSKNFPYDWFISDTLIKNVRFKDATLLINGKKNIIITCDDDLELFMYCSDDIFKGWEECPDYKKYFGNEVRPGGRIFEINNRYFIPMQNLSHAYGTSITLYEILINNNYIDLIKIKENFIGPQSRQINFSSAMHHIDIQKIDDDYLYFYDGQFLIDKKFDWWRSFKFYYLDLKSFFYNY